jgi:hypothetical protein
MNRHHIKIPELLCFTINTRTIFARHKPLWFLAFGMLKRIFKDREFDSSNEIKEATTKGLRWNHFWCSAESLPQLDELPCMGSWEWGRVYYWINTKWFPRMFWISKLKGDRELSFRAVVITRIRIATPSRGHFAPRWGGRRDSLAFGGLIAAAQSICANERSTRMLRIRPSFHSAITRCIWLPGRRCFHVPNLVFAISRDRKLSSSAFLSKTFERPHTLPITEGNTRRVRQLHWILHQSRFCALRITHSVRRQYCPTSATWIVGVSGDLATTKPHMVKGG